MIPATRAEKPGRPGEQLRNLHCGLNRGRVATIAVIASLDRFQVERLGEMSAEMLGKQVVDGRRKRDDGACCVPKFRETTPCTHNRTESPCRWWQPAAVGFSLRQVS